MAEQELEALNKTYRTVLQDIITDKEAPKSKAIQEWAKQVIDYNVPHGKKIRSLAVVMTFKLMNKNNDTKEEDREGVGMNALNDGILIDETQYLILKKHFSEKEYYVKLMDLLHQTSLYTSYGQYLDGIANRPNQRPSFELFTESKYKKVAKYKTAFYTFVLPVRLALYMSSCDSTEEHKIAEEILLKVGELAQIQNDIFDCYGDPEHIGKIGTDIEEGKCTWLAFMALKLANESDQKVLKDNIGVKNVESVKKVKDIYDKLGLKQIFEELEETTYKDVCKSIEDLKTKKSKLDPQLFFFTLNRLYKRKL